MEFLRPSQPRESLKALAAVNRQTARYGLALTQEEMTALAESRVRSLRDTGRVELGEGILRGLIEVFCDSPYLHQADYAGTLEALQTLFYHWKNEAGDLTPDEDVLRLLRRAFDRAGGQYGLPGGLLPQGACQADAGGKTG